MLLWVLVFTFPTLTLSAHTRTRSRGIPPAHIAASGPVFRVWQQLDNILVQNQGQGIIPGTVIQKSTGTDTDVI